MKTQSLKKLRVIVIGLGPLLAGFILAALLYALEWQKLSNEADGYRLEIRKLGWIAMNQGALRSSLSIAEARFEGKKESAALDEAAVASAMQTSIKAMLDAASVQIASIQPVSATDEGNVRFFGMTVQISGTYPEIIEVLQVSRKSAPSLLISAVDLMPSLQPDQSGKATSAALNQATYSAQIEFVAPKVIAK
jgi:hypothetical protein